MSRTIRRKNGSRHFTPSSNLLNPVRVNAQKEVDGVWYVGCYERVRRTREIVLNWYSIKEYIENERKAYYERWGKFETLIGMGVCSRSRAPRRAMAPAS